MRSEFNVADPILRGKMDRIQELWTLGMNVPEYFLIHDEEALNYFKREIAHKYERMSVRTYSKVSETKEFKCPHYPNWPMKTPEGDGEVQAGIMGMLEDLQKKYYILASPPINPQECLFAGNVVVPEMHEDDIIWEYIQGPGTVRDVETRGIHMVTNRHQKINLTTKDGEVIESHPDFDVVRKQILKFPREKTIIEWSIYKNPVGRGKSNIVFWEWRNYNG